MALEGLQPSVYAPCQREGPVAMGTRVTATGRQGERRPRSCGAALEAAAAVVAAVAGGPGKGSDRLIKDANRPSPEILGSPQVLRRISKQGGGTSHPKTGQRRKEACPIDSICLPESNDSDDGADAGKHP
ncbi:Hypothetical predicted protein [Podarcis lilfordi]|uniref:Uncharacterized protein n=1 Tax=Podarcis lilfordi TaxID=74358 RepID=A0AA35KRS1_9SAUR|nr:Hypothetical predicted protein [Podarcis lilfordi]